MPLAMQRGSPAIYVAGSARELPAEVQDWLARPENRALATPNLYDMLAQLARGKRFAAIVVSIQSIDWAEMDFFDHVSRLAPTTPIYVTGAHQFRAKLEAACRRGARLFDAISLTEDIAHATTVWRYPTKPSVDSADQRQPDVRFSEPLGLSSRITTPSKPQEPLEADASGEQTDRLIAARLDPELPVARPRPSAAANVRVVPEPEVPEIDEADESRAELECEELMEAADGVLECAESPLESVLVDTAEAEVFDESAVPLAEPETLISGPELVESAALELPAEIVPDAGEAELSASIDVADPTQIEREEIVPPTTDYRRMFRLAPGDEDDVRVVFPWSHQPNRPRRVPPKTPVEDTTSEVQPQQPSPPRPPTESPLKTVRLTPEEIAALMADMPRRDKSSEAQS